MEPKVNLMEPKVNLSHLAAEDQRMIYVRYIAGEDVKKLIEECGLDIRVENFCNVFEPIESGFTCSRCVNPMMFTLPSRSALGHDRALKFKCASCGHITWPFGGNRTRRCHCSNCELELVPQKTEGK